MDITDVLQMHGVFSTLAGNNKDYTHVGGIITRTNTNTDEWITMVDINGKGFVNEILFAMSNPTQNTTIYTGVRITIDGNVVYSGRTGVKYTYNTSYYNVYLHDRYVSGMTLRNNISVSYGSAIYNDNTVYTYAHIFNLLMFNSFNTNEINVLKPFPYIDDPTSATPGVAVLTVPWRFNDNVKIEIQNKTTGGVGVQYFLILE